MTRQRLSTASQYSVTTRPVAGELVSIRVAPVRTGKRAFIGAEAVILQGVEVGDDAVVGAGSVVTQSVPAGAIVAGASAKVVGTTDDLDSRRMERARHLGPLTRSHTRARMYLSAEAAAELDTRLITDREYFLAKPWAAQRFQGGD